MSIYKHENFIPLEPDTTLWRYLDLEKYKSLLETKALFFCRADKFIDPFEGSLPRMEAEGRIKEEKRQAHQFGQEFNDEIAQKNISDLQRVHQNLKRGTVINCWHINEHESDAMWRLYLKDNEGVAIQSNTKRIYETIEKITEKVGLSKVRYLNYDKDIWYDSADYPHKGYNLYIPLLHKMIELKHENEFRLLYDIPDAVDDENYWDTQPNHIGKFIEIDLESLIEKIYLPPTIDPKVAVQFEQLAKDKGYNFEFVKSRLSYTPWY